MFGKHRTNRGRDTMDSRGCNTQSRCQSNYGSNQRHGCPRYDQCCPDYSSCRPVHRGCRCTSVCYRECSGCCSDNNDDCNRYNHHQPSVNNALMAQTENDLTVAEIRKPNPAHDLGTSDRNVPTVRWMFWKWKNKNRQFFKITERLTETIDSQNDKIKELTAENKQQLMELTEAKSDIVELIGDVNNLSERVINLHDELRDTEKALTEARNKPPEKIPDNDAIHKLENKLAKLIAKSKDLEAENTSLAKTIATLETKLEQNNERETAIERLQKDLSDVSSKSKDLATENRSLAKTIATLETKLGQMDERETAIEQLKKDLSDVSSKLRKEKALRVDTEKLLVNAHEDLVKTKSMATRKESKLSQENETLKFDVAMTTNTLKEKKEELMRVEEEKQNIQDRYLKQLEYAPKYTKKCFSNNDIMSLVERDELDQYKNKALRLENTMFRKDLLIEGLIRHIRAKQPNFKLSNYPELSCCLDPSDLYNTNCNKSTNNPNSHLYDPSIYGYDLYLAMMSQRSATPMETSSNSNSVKVIKNNFLKSD